MDPDYRGNVCIVLFNFGDKNFFIVKGDRVAQLVCEKFLRPIIVEAKMLETERLGEENEAFALLVNSLKTSCIH